MRDLAIIILNYNTYQMTIDLVNSLVKIAPDNFCEIVVVDNASPNESVQKLNRGVKAASMKKSSL